LIHPSGNSEEQKPEGIENSGHLHSLWFRPIHTGN
jgi:hypothetical protein